MQDPCARDYARAFMDPFGSTRAICLPSSAANVDSIRQRLTYRGTATIGTSGVGFVAWNPSAVSTGTYALNTIAYTDATYAGAESTPISLAATGVAGTSLAGSILTEASLGDTSQVRPVLAAMRVRYIGTELNRSGQLLMWNDLEDFQTVGMTLDSITTRPTAQLVQCTREWSTLRMVPTTDFASQFNSFPTLVESCLNGPASTTNQAKRPMVAMFTGVAGQKYAFELVYYTEARVNTLQQLNTPSMVSQSGDGVINAARASSGTALQVPTFLERARQRGGDVLDSVVAGAADAGYNVGQGVMRLGAAYAARSLLGASGGGLAQLAIAM